MSRYQKFAMMYSGIVSYVLAAMFSVW